MLDITIEYEGKGDAAIAPLFEEVTTSEENGKTILKGVINDQKGRKASVKDFAFYKIMVEFRYISERTGESYKVTGRDDSGETLTFLSEKGKNTYL